MAGPSDCRAAEIHGADTGAMDWAFFPAVVTQQRAIKQYGEFPLWNRYNSSGITMIGQGQMMLGDPLTWVQWLVGADALSFDIKFMFLRVIFAAALGLSVFTVTRALRPSAMVAFAAPFIGFFVFRVNHPAIFSLCYAPLILLAWLRLAYSPDPRARFWWLAGLMAANWLVLNSGTVKEADMAILVLNAIGAAHFLVEGRRLGRHAYWRLILMLGISGACFAAIALPVVGPFLESLRIASTLSDVPHAAQLPKWQALDLRGQLFPSLSERQICRGLERASDFPGCAQPSYSCEISRRIASGDRP